jgi:hypothetical protein
MATCNWTIDTGCCTPEWGALTPDQQDMAEAYAIGLLDKLTGFRFGQCPVVLRPCQSKCGWFTGYRTWPVGQPGTTGAGAPWMIPYVDNGVWRNCGCTGGCTCRARCELALGLPVATIESVTIDGALLDPSAYRLDSVQGRGPVLVRTDGECWPECQDMEAGPADVGSFVVTLVPGESLPPEAPALAGKLACEFARACVGGDCALPQELQSLTRNGVDVQVVDPAVLPEAILTGIAEVDRWVRAVNPQGLRSRPRVFSPDVRPHRVTS